MWQFIRSRILTVIIFIGAAHGILIMSPKFIRANQDYTVGITNFNTSLIKLELIVQMEGHTDDGRNVLNVTKMVSVWRYMTKMVNFNIPEHLSAGKYKITIDGLRGFSFHKEAELMYLSKTISGLIQIDKPVFKPGDMVKFRVIVLDTELKPPARVKTIHVTISDPQNNVIREWPSGNLYAGVFDGDLQIQSAPTPVLGMWTISVLLDGQELVSKKFEVKEYRLYSFHFDVIPSVFLLEEHQYLNLTIAADHFGIPVKGLAKVELYLEDDKLDQKKEFEVIGMEQVELRFKEKLQLYRDQQDVRVKTTFIEQHTNRTVVKESQISVYKYHYRVQLVKEYSQFRPGLPFQCALQFRYQDGKPAKGITGKVEVIDIGYQTTATSDDEGLIKLELISSDNIEGMDISFSSDGGLYFDERVNKEDVVTNGYIKLELRSPVTLNRLMHLIVTCSEPMTSFAYYVVSKGNIIDGGVVRPNNKNKYIFRLIASERMIPKAKIIVATEVNNTLLNDFVDIDFEDFSSNFRLSVDMQEVAPGRQIELQVSGQPGSYVGLAAYETELPYNNLDPFWEDLMRVYNGFNSNVENEFDMFHGKGLVVRTLEDVKINEAHYMPARDGFQTTNSMPKLISYQNNMPSSWLWQNVTIGWSGRNMMNEVVPVTHTSWNLVAFAIHPLYGLGIMKKPIQLTTINLF